MNTSIRTPIRRRLSRQGPVLLALFLLTVMVGSYQAPATVPVLQEGEPAQQKPAGESPRFTYRGEQGCVDNDGVQGLNPDFRGECGDLRKADLFKTDLHGAKLSGANLSGASLTDVNLQGATLVGARLIEANLTRTDLREADLTGADMTGAHVSRTQFQGARLNRANLSEAVIRNTDLRASSWNRRCSPG